MVDVEKLSSSKSASLYFGPFADRRVAAFHINRRRRNLFLTVTDLTGAVLGVSSAKLFAADRKKRFAPHIVELIVRQLVVVLKAYRISAVRLFLKISKSFLIKPAVRALKSNGVVVTMIMDLIPRPHNGCRRRKRRRL